MGEGMETVEYESANFSEGNVSAPVNTTADFYYFYEDQQVAFIGVLLVFIVFGNSLVLLALIFDKQRKSRMNFFITQLALADMAVGLINVLTDMVWRLTVTWHGGNLGCKLIHYLQTVVTYSSTYVLVALTIDRYYAIKHPMHFSGSSRRARWLVIVAWLLSALFSSPIPFLFKEAVIQNKTQCWIELTHRWQWQVYISVVSVSLFILPAIIISMCYTVIVLTIWTKGSVLAEKRSIKGGGNATCTGVIPRAKIKTVKMTFVIVFVFILCWSPYFVFNLLQVYGYVPPTMTNIAAASFVQSLAPLNSAANPFICIFFSNHLQRILRRMPPMKWCLPALDTPTHRRHDSTATVTESLPSRRGASFRQVHVKVTYPGSQTTFTVV